MSKATPSDAKLTLLASSERKDVISDISRKAEAKDSDYALMAESKDTYIPPKVDIIEIRLQPSAPAPISDRLSFSISFDLDRDCIASYWSVKFLVDSASERIIKVLGNTAIQDYFEGDNEVNFAIDRIDVSGISRSTLSNAGLLSAAFIADGEEVATLNMVVNVFIKDDLVYREILSPLE